MKPYVLWCVLAPLLMVVEVVMDLLQPALMASIVDKGLMMNDLPHIISTGGIMLGVAIIGMVGGVGCTVFQVSLHRISGMICGSSYLSISRPSLTGIWTGSRPDH